MSINFQELFLKRYKDNKKYDLLNNKLDSLNKDRPSLLSPNEYEKLIK